MYSRTFFKFILKKKEKAELSQRRCQLDRHTGVEPTKGFLLNRRVRISNFSIYLPYQFIKP
jgi:hypothetical protein